MFLVSLILVVIAKIGTFTREKDPELMVYFNRNLKVIQAYCKEDQYYYPFMSGIIFGKMPSKYTVAYCAPRVNGFKLVFDKEYWESLDDLDKAQLMYHEMAHCMFDEPHNETDPTHFMYPEMLQIDGFNLAIQVHYFLENKCGESNGESEQ
jgi:hypothetical protein